MRVLILIVSIFFLLWVFCGLCSHFIIRHICITIDGIKPFSYIRGAPAFIVAGPLGLLIMIASLIFIKKKMGKCIEGNCFNGQGTTVYPTGEKYIGQWENGKYNGTGIYIYPDGRRITGYWKEDNLISEEKSVTNDNRKQ